MVAVVTGNGLGLERTSAWLLGARGQFGAADLGRSGEDVFVNAANGNLIVSQRDEMLIGRGPDGVVNRTYNHRGAFGDDNGDNWQAGFSRLIKSLTGTLNTTGSTITRRDWDGGEVVYAWDVDLGAYKTVEGAGAHDTLRKVNDTWEWTDGDTQVKEIYALNTSTGAYQLISQTDLDGNAVLFAYEDATHTDLVTRITTANGDANQGYVKINYTARRITDIQTFYATGQSRKTVRYGYTTVAGVDRLTSVTVDLTPEDGAITDGRTYVTTYGYDSAGRVTSIVQTDGSSLSITYDSSNRVYQLTQAVSSGVTRTTTFAYGVETNGDTYTTATTGGLTTKFTHAGGLLTKVEAPSPVSGGTTLTTTYHYDGDDNLIAVRDPTGRVTLYRPHKVGGKTTGNIDVIRDSAGGTVWRTFGSRNELLTETRFTVADAIGSAPPNPITLTYVESELDKAGASLPSGGLTTRFVYDASNHLRYIVSPAGRVSEQVWNSAGQMTRTRTYTADFKDLSGLSVSDSIALSVMDAWIDARVDSTVTVVDYAYDVRGALDYTTAYSASVTSGGLAAGDGSAAKSTTDFAYDHRGRLIGRIVDGQASGEEFFYDGLNRLVGQVDFNGAETRTIFQDKSGITIVSFDTGLQRTQRYNLVGELISTSESGYNQVDASGWPADPSNLPSGNATVPWWQNTTTYVDEAVWASTTGPDGRQVAAIHTGQTNADASGGGGETNVVSLDGSKAYEFTFYFRKADLTKHTLAFGLLYNATAYVENAVTGADTPSAFFYSASAATQQATLKNDRWYKVVGYLLPEGSAAITAGSLGGVYDMETGEKVASTNAFRWNPERLNNNMTARFFTSGDESQQGLSTYFYRPEIRQTPVDTVLQNVGPPSNHYRYDVNGRLRLEVDPTGAATHFLYDNAGRKVADIAGDGSMVEYRYDADGRMIASTRYFNRLSSSQLGLLADAAFNPLSPTLSSIRPTASSSKDAWEWRVHDDAGRLAFTIDGRGAVVTYTYDAASRLLSTQAYNDRLATATVTAFKTTPPDASTVSQALTSGDLVASTTNDRLTRFFYDADSRQTAMLDAEGFLTRTFYDAAGRVAQQSAYNNVSSLSVSARATASLSSLISSVTTSAANDIHTWSIYDKRGFLMATINGEGDLVRYQYNALGHVTQQIRGQRLTTLPTPLTTAGVLTGLPTLADLPSAPSGTQLETTNLTYDNYGRVLTETKVLDSGSDVTTYVYDGAGRVVGRTTTPNVGTARTASYRYDVQGRLIGELGGEGSAALAALGAGSSRASVDAVYRDWGVTYAYDEADRLISKTTASGAGGGGNTTLYYYDLAGRLVYEINALREVKEHKYDGQGQLTDVIVFSKAMSTTDYAGLVGGLKTAAVDAKVNVLRSDGYPDQSNQYAYDVVGNLTSHTSARSVVTTYAYSAFRQMLTNTVSARAGFGDDVTRQISYAYTRRGHLKTQTVDPTVAGEPDELNLVTQFVTDAFGRVTQTTDPNVKNRYTKYDRAGRVIELKDALLKTTTFTYDGRGLVVSQTDRNNDTTTFAYNAFSRTVTTTTQEGVVTTTTNNAFGQSVSVAVGGSTRTFTYDRDGNLTASDDGSGVVTTFEYDKAGRLKAEVEEDGRRVEYSYDALNRVFKRTVDPTIPSGPAELNLVTEYEFNPFGQTIQVKDPAGIITKFEFDLDGHRTVMVQDEGSGRLNLRTEFKTDNAGRTYEITEGFGSPAARVTKHTFDKADRRVKTVIDPGVGGENITTEFFYDKVGNVVASKDALGNVTRFAYDGENRLTRRVDAHGAATEIVYDNEGRVVWEVERATAIEVASLATVATAAELTAPQATNDRYHFNAYDRDGRLRFRYDPGRVTEYTYSARGDVVLTRAYVASLPGNVVWSYAGLSAAVNAAGFANAADRMSSARFDGAGRMLMQSDAEGYVTEYVYNVAGRLDKVLRHTPQLAAGTTPTASALAAIDANYASKAAVEQYVYDTAGRVVQTLRSVDGSANITTALTLDALGRAVEITTAPGTADETKTVRVYDRVGRMTSETRGHGTPEASTRSFVYDALGNTVKITDGRGKVGYFHYDARNRLILQVDPEGYVTKTEYLASTDPNEAGFEVIKVTRFWLKASAIGNETTDPTYGSHAKDAVTSIVKDRDGRVVRMVDAEGQVERYEYTVFGDRWKVINKVGATTTYTFDARGLVLTETLPITAANGAGTQIAVVNAYVYDAMGQLVTKTEAQGALNKRVTTYQYDRAGRLRKTIGEAVSVTNANLSVTAGVTPTEELVYDSRGNVIATINAAGARTLFYYDRLDRKVAEIDATGAYRSWSYDANDNVKSAKVYDTTVTPPVNPGGTAPTAPAGGVRETLYAYDDLNRLKETKVQSVLWGVLTGSGHQYAAYTSDITSTQTYDAMGNVTSRTDGHGLTTFHYYDAMGREVARVDQDKFLTVWERDAEGNVTKEIRYATALTGTIQVSVQPNAPTGSAADRTTEFEYDRNGRRTVERRLGVAAYAVDQYGQMSSAGSVAAVITYGYDALGNVAWKREANQQTGNANDNHRTQFDYDNVGRLVRVTSPEFTEMGTTAVRRVIDTAYDGLNNVIKTREGKASENTAIDRVTTYVYGAGGRLASMTDASGHVTNYGYDAAGRVTAEWYALARSDQTTVVIEGRTYAYDAAGRLTQQTGATYSGSAWTVSTTDKTQFAYNAHGELTQKGYGGVWQETFAYDKAGRMWRSTAGDGTLKFYIHDRNGNLTYQVAATTADLSTIDTQGKLLNRISVAQTSDTTTTATDIGQNAIAGVLLTGFAYTQRNQQSHTYETLRELATGASATNLSRSRAYNAFGEVVSETDARGNTTEFSYNTMGRLILRKSPQVWVTSEAGVASQTRPEETYFHDVAGRLIGVQDANGNLTTRNLLAGTGYGDDAGVVIKETHLSPANGSGVRSVVLSTSNWVDVFGDLRVEYNGAGVGTQNFYDKMGRLTAVIHPTRAANSPGVGTSSVTLTDYYAYDGLGRRIRHWNSQLTSAERTDYDAQNRITRQEAFGGVITQYSYAWSTGVATSGLGTFGGWTKTTTHASGKVSTETTDVFGRLTARTELHDSGAASNTYVTHSAAYDKGGRLTAQTSTAGRNTTYTYFNTGRVAQIDDGQTTSTSGVNTARTISTYAYDADGNRTKEKMVSTTYTWYAVWGQLLSSPAQSTVTLQDATVIWDAMNRMTEFKDVARSTTDYLKINYEYDAQGNQRRVLTDWRSGYGPTDTVAAYPQTSDEWFKYDAMNRMTTVRGELVGGAIVRGSKGSDLTYDTAGRRASMTQTRTVNYLSDTWAWHWDDPYSIPWDYPEDIYNGSINPNNQQDQHWVWRRQEASTTGAYTEGYVYTADGYLAQTVVTRQVWDDANNVLTWSSPVVIGTDMRDAMGRLTAHYEANLSGSLVYTQLKTYDERSNLLTETIHTFDWDTAPTQMRARTIVNTYQYNAETSLNSGVWTGAYMGGAATFLSSKAWFDVEGENSAVTTTTRTIYAWGDGPRTDRIIHDILGDQPGPTESRHYYDVNGRLTFVDINDGRPRTVTYVSDGAGQVLSRVEFSSASYNPKSIAYYFDGLKVADITNDGDGVVDYMSVVSRRVPIAPGGGGGAFQWGAYGGTQQADFSQAYDVIHPNALPATARQVTVRAGDTLQAIAASVWGDASMWWMIAEANGLSGSEALIAGQTLSIPAKVSNFHNTSDTFRPYDPNKAIGDTSPMEARPADRGGACGGVGQMIAVAIAVVVTAVLAPYAIAAIANLGAAAGTTFTVTGLTVVGTGGATVGAGAFVAGSAIAGAAGSVASQAFSLATGMQKSFDWKAVGMAALSSAVGAGIGRIAQGARAGSVLSNLADDTFRAGALRGALGSVVTQGVGVATGLQDEFSWADVAVQAIGGGVSNRVQAWSGADEFGLVSGLAGGIAGAGARSLVEGSDFGDNLMSALPGIIGNTIGNALAGRIVVSAAASGAAKSGATPKPVYAADLQSIIDQSQAVLDRFDRWDGFSPDAIAEMEAMLSAGLQARLRGIGTPVAGSPASLEGGGFLSFFRNGAEALTALTIGTKELTFGTLLAPLAIPEATALGFMGGFNASREDGNGFLGALGDGLQMSFTDTFDRGIPSFLAQLGRADNGLAFWLGNMDRRDPTILDSVRDLIGATPLFGHLIIGGNEPAGSPTGDRSISISQGIRARDVEDDIARNAGLQDYVEGLVGPESRVLQVTYPWGTVTDVALSLLNLSHGSAYDASQQILDSGVGPGDVIDLVAHSGGVQRSAMVSRILGNYGIYGDRLVGLAGPALGSFNNLNSISLAGSTDWSGWREPTANLQWITRDLAWASGSRENVSYANFRASDGGHIPHNAPDLDNWLPVRGIFADGPYFKFIRIVLGPERYPPGF